MSITTLTILLTYREMVRMVRVRAPRRPPTWIKEQNTVHFGLWFVTPTTTYISLLSSALPYSAFLCHDIHFPLKTNYIIAKINDAFV